MRIKTPEEFQFIVSTLDGRLDVGVLLAAARAGGIAVLNLEAVSSVADVDAASAALLSASELGRIGVRIDRTESIQLMPSKLIDAVNVVVLTADAVAEDMDL